MITLEPNDALVKNQDFQDWLVEHSIDPATCYKLEIEGDQITVYNYAIDGAGKKYIDEASGVAVVDAPVTIKLKRKLPDIESSGGTA